MRVVLLVLALFMSSCVEPSFAGPLPFETPGDDVSFLPYMDVATAIPSFGGVYFDEGAVHVLLTVDATEEEREAARAFGQELDAQWRTQNLPRHVVLGHADFSYLDLADYRARGLNVMSVKGVHSYGIDIRANRILVGIAEDSVDGPVRVQWSAAFGLPLDVLTTEVVAPFELL